MVIIHKFNEFKLLNLKQFVNLLKPEKTNKNYFIKNNSDIYIQTNKMKCCQNFYKYDNKMYINFEITNKNVLDLFVKIDNYILRLLVKKFDKWFNKSAGTETLLEYFIPTINQEDKIDSLVLEVPVNKKNNIDINIYNENNNLININELISIDKCQNIIGLNGIFLNNSRFYCNWVLFQMKLH